MSDEESGPNRQIYTMRTDGSERTRLSHDRNNYANPVYFPDGATILSNSETPDGSNEIYIMESDGSNQTRLTFSDLLEQSARFTPDGLKIVYCATKVSPTSNYSYESDIYLMNIDGSSKTCLTEESACHFYAPFLGRSSWFMQHNLHPFQPVRKQTVSPCEAPEQSPGQGTILQRHAKRTSGDH